MKTYTIGRDPSCRIPINDIRISRQHAILRVYTFGKMEIVDLAKNGTWVNGVKLRPNIPFPVKRKDVVNLGNAVQLDWSYVPDPLKYVRIGIISLIIIIAFVIAICSISNLLRDNSSMTPYNEKGQPVAPSLSEGNRIEVDSLNRRKTPSAQREKAKEAAKEPKDKTLEGLFPQKEVDNRDSTKGKQGKTKANKPQTDKKEPASKDEFKEDAINGLEIL